MRITLSAVRHLLITTHSIYNFEPDSYRKFNRKINLGDLTGIIVSVSSEQILLQVYRSHDFHLIASTNNSRTNLVENICVAYSALGFDPKQTPPLRGERYLPVTAEVLLFVRDSLCDIFNDKNVFLCSRKSAISRQCLFPSNVLHSRHRLIRDCGSNAVPFWYLFSLLICTR
jgi:hypothetical protein